MTEDAQAQQGAYVNMLDLDKNTGGRNLLITLTVFIFFDFVFVGIRIYERRLRRKSWELNDYALLFGFVSFP
jgi:hypothetical protein